jgi:Zn-dependent peptidase ImmA (M78 family)
MEIEPSAPVKLARRVVDKYGLEPPIDIEKLVSERAKLVFATIPVDGVDGVCLNLKAPGKEQTVVVNAKNPKARQRFTLAHELGHILIPWHTGSVVDHLDPEETGGIEGYWAMEQEANAFAAELLMPSNWLKVTLSKAEDLAMVHLRIASKCDVSLQAAAIRLAKTLPKNAVYAVARDGVVEFAGRSDGTLANTMLYERPFNPKAYDYAESHYTGAYAGREVHWWRLPQRISVRDADGRDWRTILDEIVDDLGLADEDEQRFKNSVNGVVAYANSVAKRSADYSVATVMAACIQRFKDRAEFKAFARHPAFEAFIVKKAEALVH